MGVVAQRLAHVPKDYYGACAYAVRVVHVRRQQGCWKACLGDMGRTAVVSGHAQAVVSLRHRMEGTVHQAEIGLHRLREGQATITCTSQVAVNGREG